MLGPLIMSPFSLPISISLAISPFLITEKGRGPCIPYRLLKFTPGCVQFLKKIEMALNELYSNRPWDKNRVTLTLQVPE
jgi:hypothetical protein